MAKQQKMVEDITSMEVDFAKWYTDVVKKAELVDYSSVKGCMIIRIDIRIGKTSRQIWISGLRKAGMKMCICPC